MVPIMLNHFTFTVSLLGNNFLGITLKCKKVYFVCASFTQGPHNKDVSCIMFYDKHPVNSGQISTIYAVRTIHRVFTFPIYFIGRC